MVSWIGPGPDQTYRDLRPDAKAPNERQRRLDPPKETAMTVPFDQLTGQVWLDGKLVPGPQAQIHVLTHGLHYASAVFEGERAYNGVIFECTKHSERLKNSAG